MKTKEYLFPFLFGLVYTLTGVSAIIAGTPWLFLAWWLICTFWHHGLNFGFFQNTWPSIAAKYYREDMRRTLWDDLYGPISLSAMVILLWDKKSWPKLKWF